MTSFYAHYYTIIKCTGINDNKKDKNNGERNGNANQMDASMNHIDEPALVSLSSNHPSHSNVHAEMEHDKSKAAATNDVTTETVNSANKNESDVGSWLVTIANTPLPVPTETETETEATVASTAVQNTRDGARVRGMFKAVSKFKKSAKRAKMTVAEKNFRRNSGLEEEEEDVQDVPVVVEAKVKEIISKELPEEAAVEVDPNVETNDFVTTNSTSLGTFLNNDDLGNEMQKKSKKKKKSPNRSRKSGTASGDAISHTTHTTNRNQVNELGHRPSMLHVNDE